MDNSDCAIANGIPLPKGHGRLIDVDEIDEIKCPIKMYNTDDHKYGVYMEDIRKLPTVIEADKHLGGKMVK